MVTGIETAGLVLASIPLVVSFAEHYRSGLKPFRDLHNFNREFQSHAVHVGTQHALFRMNLDKLLRQIVPAAEAELLMKDPGGLAWTDAQLDEKFKKRLGESYGPIMDNIAQIKGVIERLKKGLGATSTMTPTCISEAAGGGKPAPPESLPFFIRLHFTFSRAKWGDLVQLLERHNDNISRLLEGSEERYAAAAPSVVDEKRQLVAAVQKARDSVDTIHKAIEQSWRCACPVTHHTCLMLHDRSGDQVTGTIDLLPVVPSAEKFDLLFRYGSVSVAPQTSPWDFFDVTVKLRAANKSQLSSPTQLAKANKSTSSSLFTSTYAAVTKFGNQAGKSLQPVATLSAKSQPGSSPRQSGRATAGEEIRCLCAAISAAKTGQPRLGLICEDAGHGDFRLCSADDFRFKIDSPVLHSLEDLLGTASSPAIVPSTLSRHQRFRAALAIASSYLYLHQSPWLPDSWSKRNVLVRPDVSATTPQLFVDPDAAPLTLATTSAIDASVTSPSTSNAPVSISTTTMPQKQIAIRQSLRALGIVLLELCFGHALEAHPVHKQLQLCNMPDEVLADVAARQWQRSVYGEAGPDYGRAVQACVSGDLEMRHVRPADLLVAVYASVVQPLERAVRQFEGLDDALAALSFDDDNGCATAPLLGASSLERERKPFMTTMRKPVFEYTPEAPAFSPGPSSVSADMADGLPCAPLGGRNPQDLRILCRTAGRAMTGTSAGGASNAGTPPNSAASVRHNISQRAAAVKRDKPLLFAMSETGTRPLSSSPMVSRRCGSRKSPLESPFNNAVLPSGTSRTATSAQVSPHQHDVHRSTQHSAHGESWRRPAAQPEPGCAQESGGNRERDLVLSAAAEAGVARVASKRPSDSGGLQAYPNMASDSGHSEHRRPRSKVVANAYTTSGAEQHPSKKQSLAADTPRRHTAAYTAHSGMEYQWAAAGRDSVRDGQDCMPPPSAARSGTAKPQRTALSSVPLYLSDAELRQKVEIERNKELISRQWGQLRAGPQLAVADTSTPAEPSLPRAPIRNLRRRPKFNQTRSQAQTHGAYFDSRLRAVDGASAPASSRSTSPAAPGEMAERNAVRGGTDARPPLCLGAMTLQSDETHPMRLPFHDDSSAPSTAPLAEPAAATAVPLKPWRRVRGDGYWDPGDAETPIFNNSTGGADSPIWDIERDNLMHMSSFMWDSLPPPFLPSVSVRSTGRTHTSMTPASAFYAGTASVHTLSSEADVGDPHKGSRQASWRPADAYMSTQAENSSQAPHWDWQARASWQGLQQTPAIGYSAPASALYTPPHVRGFLAPMQQHSSSANPFTAAHSQQTPKGSLFDAGSSQRALLPPPTQPIIAGKAAGGAAAPMWQGGNTIFALAPNPFLPTTDILRGEVEIRARQCLRSFVMALRAFNEAPRRTSKESAGYCLLSDELGRFRIWAASSDILSKSDNGSFDARYSQSSRAEVARQTLKILEELRNDLDEGESLVKSSPSSGAGEKRERVGKLLDDMELDPSHRTEVLTVATEDPAAQLRRLFASIAAHVGDLLKLSAVVAQPTGVPSHAMGISSDSTVTTQTAADEALVLRMFPLLQRHTSCALVLSRLARAIGLRREHLSKRMLPSKHGARLGSGNDATFASLDESGVTDASGTQPFFVARRPEGCMHGVQFLCPFCLCIITTTSDISWKIHVMNDIRPYICTSASNDTQNETCSAASTLFSDRRAWFEHELAAHRRQRQCRVCAVAALSRDPASMLSSSNAPAPHTYESAAKLNDHLRTKHLAPHVPPEMQLHMLAALGAASEKPVAHFLPTDCVFCAGTAWSTAELERAREDWQADLAAALANNLTTTATPSTSGGDTTRIPDAYGVVSPAFFAKHVGRHLEQLALGALHADGVDVVEVATSVECDDGDASDVDAA